MCQKKYFWGHLVDGSLGHIVFENAKFDLKKKNIDPLDCFFSQIIIDLKTIYIFYKFKNKTKINKKDTFIKQTF